MTTWVEKEENVDTLTWEEAEARFPGCSAQWDAQLCTPVPDVVLFINGLDSVTAAWVNPARATSVDDQRYSLYAWWSIPERRWVFKL